jgi:hypothetical protein
MLLMIISTLLLMPPHPSPVLPVCCCCCVRDTASAAAEHSWELPAPISSEPLIKSVEGKGYAAPDPEQEQSWPCQPLCMEGRGGYRTLH